VDLETILAEYMLLPIMVIYVQAVNDAVNLGSEAVKVCGTLL
jgi:hypothetical protein